MLLHYCCWAGCLLLPVVCEIENPIEKTIIKQKNSEQFVVVVVFIYPIILSFQIIDIISIHPSIISYQIFSVVFVIESIDFILCNPKKQINEKDDGKRISRIKK